MRLIDADELLERVEASMKNNTHRNGNAELNHISEHMHFMRLIVDQPTAFELKNIIKQLEILRVKTTEESCPGAECELCMYSDICKDVSCADVHALDSAIEIVKRGEREC